MEDEQIEIDVDRMIDKALSYKGKRNVTIYDLMTEEEASIYRDMHESKRISVKLPFNLRLVRMGIDRKIVPSIRLGDDRIFINPGKYDKPY